MVNCNAAGSSRAGRGQRTRGRGGHKKPDRGEKKDKRAAEASPECNNISEANVLFVDVVFGNLSAIFLAAVAGSYSALTPTLFFALCQTRSESLTHLDRWLKVSGHHICVMLC